MRVYRNRNLSTLIGCCEAWELVKQCFESVTIESVCNLLWSQTVKGNSVDKCRRNHRARCANRKKKQQLTLTTVTDEEGRPFVRNEILVHGAQKWDSTHGSAQLFRRIPAWIPHPSDLRSRLTDSLRTWATTAPKGVCACDAQYCREKRHVHCGPSYPTITDPGVTAWWRLHCVVGYALLKQCTLVRVSWRFFLSFSVLFPSQVLGLFLCFTHFRVFHLFTGCRRQAGGTTIRRKDSCSHWGCSP